MKEYRIKYWLYERDQSVISILVLLLLVITVISIIDIMNDDSFISQVEFRAWVAIIAGLITLLFAFMKQKHNDMSVFFTLFEKYNSRYDDLNEIMNHLDDKTKNKLVDEEEDPFDNLDGNCPQHLRKNLTNASTVKHVLDDYLNLCAEEYMAYSAGYIPPKIMSYWVNGMEIFFRNKHMKKYFYSELLTDSYYEFKGFALKIFDEMDRGGNGQN